MGVPFNPAPMDFSAWVEVYLSGNRCILHARQNQLRIGREIMAHGRDAIDTALTPSFELLTLERFNVWTTEV